MQIKKYLENLKKTLSRQKIIGAFFILLAIFALFYVTPNSNYFYSFGSINGAIFMFLLEILPIVLVFLGLAFIHGKIRRTH